MSKSQEVKNKAQNKVKKVYPERSRRVFVGLSGGVDSAVSAALLQEQGFDVTGVFIKAWTPSVDMDGFTQSCTWREDRRSAMRAAALLDIPFITLDLEKEYKQEVVDYMVREYKEGKTPNPDVMCNKEIKFGAFLNWALEKDVDFVATGHYAELSKNKNGSEVLSEAKDKNKDQSYFLWTLTHNQLSHVLFPVGNLEKKEVRKLAMKFKLPQATRKDSQGLCFLGQVDMKEFLSHYIEQKRGDVLNENGEVIGYHNGALFFTLGERHGFTITNKTNEDEPLYVIGKDVEKNTITVASKAEKISSDFSVLLTDVNWINEVPKKEILCRFRYRQEKIKCRVEGEKLIFKNSQEAVSSGQSVVFYDKEICLGGGVIL